MATGAEGLARIVSELDDVNWVFQPYYGTGYVANITLLGGWNKVDNKIIWAGTNPEAQNTDANSRDVDAVTVGFGSNASDRIFAHIPHSVVTLNQNDKIVYTTVEVAFSTASTIS